MSQGLFCPHCQLLNKDDADICVHCGFKLEDFKPPSSTTVNVGNIVHAQTKPQNRCENYVSSLAPGDLALFVMDEDEPIIVEDVDKLVLGRESEGAPGLPIDLESYSPFKSGISRKHVQISWDDNGFWLEDLRSTNGTWLNKERLAAGMTYQLRPEDKIWIGPLKLMVCFKQVTA